MGEGRLWGGGTTDNILLGGGYCKSNIESENIRSDRSLSRIFTSVFPAKLSFFQDFGFQSVTIFPIYELKRKNGVTKVPIVFGAKKMAGPMFFDPKKVKMKTWFLDIEMDFGSSGGRNSRSAAEIYQAPIFRNHGLYLAQGEQDP